MDGLTAARDKRQVLVFDSDPDATEMLSDIFAGFGFTVVKVEDARAAMEGLEADFPAIIVADLDHKGLPAIDILREIGRREFRVDTLVTGTASPAQILDVFRNGAADFLPKPLDGDELRMRIAALLNRRERTVVPSDDFSAHVPELLNTMERNNLELTNLLKISSSLNVAGDSKEILNRLTELAGDSMNCEAASIMLINERERVLEFVVATGEKKTRLETISIPIGEGIAGWVAFHGEPQIVNDTRIDSRFTGKVDEESGFETRQILATPLRLDSRIIGVLEVINSRDRRVFTENDLRALNAIGDRAATIIETTRTIEFQQNFYIQVTNIIVKSIEKKDVYAEGHPWRVAELCHKIGTAMDMTETEKNDLHYGALLHDIGKLDMPSSIFGKRNLSERELDLIRQHPVKGAKLLNPIILWNAVVPFVLYHQESWDGSGYPFGRSGTDIPIQARIINLAEAFSVMRSPNSYKKQFSTKEAVLEVMRASERQFDPDVVKTFIGVLEKDPSVR